MIPRTGQTVDYYPNPGATEPWIGQIVAAYHNGLCRLTVYDPGTDQWKPKQQVHHKDSSSLKDNPNLAVKLGYWAYADGAPVTKPEPPKQPAPQAQQQNNNKGPVARV